MSIDLCGFCGKPFQATGSKTCPACALRLDEAFLEAREYIYEDGDAAYKDVLENTGVSDRELAYLIKTEKIELKNIEGSSVRCAACGKPASRGRLCVRCAAELERQSRGIRSQSAGKEREAGKPPSGGKPKNRGILPLQGRN